MARAEGLRTRLGTGICVIHPSAESAMDLWEHFFRRLVSFLHLTAAREDGATQDVAEATVLKLDSFFSRAGSDSANE